MNPSHAQKNARRTNGQFGEQHHAETPTPDTVVDDGDPQEPHGLVDDDYYDTLHNFAIEADNAPSHTPETDGTQYSRLMYGVADHISRTHPSGFEFNIELVRETDMPDRQTGFVCGLKVHTATGRSYTMMRDELDIDRSYTHTADDLGGLPYNGYDSVKPNHTALLALYEELVSDATADGFTATPPRRR